VNGQLQLKLFSEQEHEVRLRKIPNTIVLFTDQLRSRRIDKFGQPTA
jgi:hypothetical protein